MPDRANRIRDLLERVEKTLVELASLQSDRQEALARMDQSRLAAINEREVGLCSQLEQGAAQREEILREGPTSASSLMDVIARLPARERVDLAARFERVAELSGRVKQEATANWLATYRLGAHVEEMLALLSGVRSDGSATRDSSGGVLDSRF